MSEILYIFGAGRSGSTVLASVLNDHEEIQNTGELHHFFPYLNNNEYCSCGSNFEHCEFWGDVKNNLSEEFIDNIDTYESVTNQMEYHSAIPRHLLSMFSENDFEQYRKAQFDIFNAVHNGTSRYILDTAKYIGRFLALRKVLNGKIKGIYLVRDVRGVIWSFKKNVQTQNSPFRTLIYYLLVNCAGQIVLWSTPNRQILKVKYEDFVEQPAKILNQMGDFLEIDFTLTIDKVQNQEPIEIAHLIGGNRIKKNSTFTLRKDTDWIDKMTFFKKVVFYITALPLMIINKYKVLK